MRPVKNICHNLPPLRRLLYNKVGGLLASALLMVPALASGQIGSYRNKISLGVNGGYMMSSLSFVPKVTQSQHGGLTGGLTFRYVSEKYFNTICAIQAEVNYAQAGWKERLVDYDENPVINEVTGQPERYSRTINYLQIPVFAHLAWGREERGMNFFVNLGPQFGYYLSESEKINFQWKDMNVDDRSNWVVAQDTMKVENKMDYGIAVGAGVEYSVPRAGHLLFEGRYYYGLGNIYGDTKRDYFARSNFGQIVLKLTYLFDLSK